MRPRYLALPSLLLVLTWTPLSAQTPTAAVVATIQIPDSHIVGISVGDDGEVAVYDRTPSTSGSVVRYLQASVSGPSVTVSLEPETVSMVGDAPGFKGWMLRDGPHLYVLAQRNRSTEHGLSTWESMRIYILENRASYNSIGYNDTAIVHGDEPWSAPEDFRYAVNGFVIKPADAENGNNARIIIDDTLKGNLDVLDLNSAGTAMASQVRWSYRARHETGCEWPDIDPGPFYTCHWVSNIGPGLALEWAAETVLAPPYPDLLTVDDLYILDPIYDKTSLRRIELDHPGAAWTPVQESDIDLEAFHWILTNGVEGLYPAHGRDKLWIGTGLQQFAEGFVSIMSTVDQSGTVIDPVLGDQNLLMVDPRDHTRVFIPASDNFLGSTSLFIREVRNGVTVNSVTAFTGYTPYRLDVAAFDPVYGLCYLAIDDTIWAVQVTDPDLSIFVDDFESGGLTNWSNY